MEIVIHGDKVKVTKAMKDYIEEKLSKLDKYLENSETVRANVIVKVTNHEQRVEITIPLKSFTIDKLERQIRKNKTRLMSKKIKQSMDFNFENFTSNEEEKNESKRKIVKRKKIEVKPMNEEEAILQMELLGHEFYMYKDSDTNEPAVVYKRKDSNYGLIESE